MKWVLVVTLSIEALALLAAGVKAWWPVIRDVFKTFEG